MKYRKCTALLLAALLAGSLAACGPSTAEVQTGGGEAGAAQETINAAFGGSDSGKAEEDRTAAEAEASNQEDGGWFTDRDLAQTADLENAVTYTAEDGKDITITEAGVYVLSGSASEVTVTVDAGDEDKVQLVLDGLTLTNADFPCIYVKNADKVFVTTTDTGNSLSVTGTFTADGETGTDAVIFSKDDLVLNGTGTLTISSTDNGVTSKDDLKITGGTLVIDCAADALEANDAIAAADGDLTITAGKDGLHAENDEGGGEIYISGGTFTVTAGSDAIQGTTAVQIDGGTFDLEAAEGIEATCVKIGGGTIAVSASDDGINAARKSSAADPAVEITGGELTIAMGQGDVDAIDSNGSLTISGGTVDITAQSPFDYDGTGTLSGGTVTVNGQAVTALTNQMMGGGMGGFPGGMQEGRQFDDGSAEAAPALPEGEAPSFGRGGRGFGGQPPQGGRPGAMGGGAWGAADPSTAEAGAF